MKKHILFLSLFALLFSFGLFINTNSVGAQVSTSDCVINNTLRQGSTGSEVSCLQTKLGLTADGKFGRGTKAALMVWQSAHGLVADGVLGARSRAILNSSPVISIFPAGCESSVGYSSITGEPCGPYRPGCTSFSGYNSITGESCGAVISSLISLQEIFPEGCTSINGWNSLTGESCSQARFDWKIWVRGYGFKSGSAMKTFSTTTGNLITMPISFLSSTQFSFVVPKSAGTGNHNFNYVDSTGAESQSNAMTLTIVDSTSTTPVISGVSGPQTLKAGEKGTWKVSAYGKSEGNLSYGVVWGDEPGYVENVTQSNISEKIQQSATFTHAYSQADTYYPKFIVTNSSGQSAETSLSVKVGSVSIYDLLSVKMGNVTYESVTDSGDTTQVTYNIPLTITALRDTQYMGLAWEYEKDDALDKKLAGSFELQDSTAPTTGLESGVVSSVFTCNAGIESGTAYRLDEGEDVRCTLQVIMTSGPTASHSFRVQLNQIQTYANSALNINWWLQDLLPVENYRTAYKFITDGGSTTTPSITVLSPNGGETWVNGTDKVITWTDNQSSGVYNIHITYDYGKPGGGSSLVGYNVPGSSYKWTVFGFGSSEGVGNRYKIEVCRATNITSAADCDTSDNYFKITNATSTNHLPAITQFPSSQTVNAGEEVTYRLIAKDDDNDDLSWRIDWGDGTPSFSGVCPVNPPVRSGKNWTITFSHTWQKAGTYKMLASVHDCKGGGDERSSMITAISSISTPSITVLSPNGGDIIRKGSSDATGDWLNYKIEFSSQKKGSVCEYITTSNSSNAWGNSKYYNLGCGQGYASGISQITSGSYQINNIYAPGMYYFLATWQSQDGTEYRKDFSDKTFTIVSETITNSSPKIGPIAILEGIRAGQSVNFNFNATDVDNDDLSWSLDWGEGIGSTTTCQINPTTGSKKNWTYSSSHTWEKAGTYTVKVSVNDCKGGSDSESFTVNVGAITTTPLSITTSSPLPNAKVGVPYSVALNTTGGDPGFHGWTVNNGAQSFPIPGLGISSSYGNPIYITGTPVKIYENSVELKVAKIFIFTVEVVSGTEKVSKQFSLTVDPATPISLPTVSTSPVTNITATSATSGGTVISDGGSPVTARGVAYNSLPTVTINNLHTNDGTGIGSFTSNFTQNLRSNTTFYVRAYATNSKGTAYGETLPFTTASVLGAEAFHFTQWLDFGSSGNEVMELQKFLNNAGYDIGMADGQFGSKTKAAVIQFEIANGLKGDGIVGPMVRAILNK